MLASTMAHADYINNYDADGNLIGHSEVVHETDSAAMLRMRSEIFQGCVSAQMMMHAPINVCKF